MVASSVSVIPAFRRHVTILKTIVSSITQMRNLFSQQNERTQMEVSGNEEMRRVFGPTREIAGEYRKIK
jgi:hypothetical protein